MTGEELKESIEESTAEYLKVNESYRQQVSTYCFSLVVSELAVVGFLLQNQTARKSLDHYLPKSLLLTSIFSCFLSLLCGVLSRRFYVRSSKNRMHAMQYKAIANPNIINVSVDGNNMPPLEEPDLKSSAFLKKSYKQSLIAVKFSKLVEPLFALGVLLSVVFLTVLVVSI